MKFQEFLNNQAQKDKENNTSTRYILDYNKTINMPILVALTTGESETRGKSIANIAIYGTDLPGWYNRLGSSIEDYKDSIAVLVKLGNFEVETNPLTTLASNGYSNSSIEKREDNLVVNYATVRGDHAVITDVSTKDDYVRCGLGSYAIQVIQDYYKKSNCIGVNEKNRKILFAQRKRLKDSVVYASKLERKLGSVGDVIAHSRAKFGGNKCSSEKIYDAFLAKNNFDVEIPAMGWTKKPIIHDRHILSESLVNSKDNRILVQLFDESFGEKVDYSNLVLER